MGITITGRVVLFDYGEVISMVPSTAARAELERLVAPSTPEALWASYWHHRPALDQAQQTVEDYWGAIGRDLGVQWTDAQCHALWSTDFRSWLEVNQEVLDVLIDLRQGGTRMAMLSNAGPDFSSYYRHGMLGQYFEGVFTSGELGMLKPDPAIFETVTDVLGVSAGDVVFVDDRAVNVESAQALGMVGHVFSGAGHLRQFLEGLEGTQPASPTGGATPRLGPDL